MRLVCEQVSKPTRAAKIESRVAPEFGFGIFGIPASEGVEKARNSDDQGVAFASAGEGDQMIFPFTRCGERLITAFEDLAMPVSRFQCGNRCEQFYCAVLPVF